MTSSEKKHKIYMRAELAYEDQINELVVENYDKLYSYPGDTFDRKTKCKLQGYHDPEQVIEWQHFMDKTLKRRMQRSREKAKDKSFFSQKNRI